METTSTFPHVCHVGGLIRKLINVEDVDGNYYQIDDWRQLPRLTREILGL